MNTKDYVVRLEDLKRPIEENPYDPNTGNIAAYMRYLRYNTPPAKPEPKRGRWIYKTDLITAPYGYWECSKCKEGRLLYEENFCPHCGADMRGEQDEP